MIVENAMYFFNMPLFDVVRVRVGKIEQAFGKVANNGVFMKKLLIVEALRKMKPLRGGADDSALISED